MPTTREHIGTFPTHDVETRYGAATVSALGWGLRIAGDELTVNGVSIRANGSYYNHGATEGYQLGRPDQTSYEQRQALYASRNDPMRNGRYEADVSSSAFDKLREELTRALNAWAIENVAAIAEGRRVYLNNEARTAEEGIQRLEAALEKQREALAAIEAGDIETSPYAVDWVSLRIDG